MADYICAPDGLATNSGTLASPWSLTKGLTDAQAGDRLLLRGGKYFEEPRPSNFGTSGNPITIESYSGERARITSFEELDNQNWTVHSGNIYKIQLDASYSPGLGYEQVVCDGVLMPEARYPSLPVGQSAAKMYRGLMAFMDGATFDDQQTPDGEGYYSVTIQDANLNQSAGFWVGAQGVIVPGHEWHAYEMFVTASAPGSITAKYKWNGLNTAIAKAGNPFWLWNKLEILDTEGEWYFDRDGVYGPAYTLYFYPPGGAIGTQVVEVRKSAFFLNIPANAAYWEYKHLDFYGMGVEVHDTASNMYFEDILMRLPAHNLGGTSDWKRSGIRLKGSDHVFKNSSVLESASAAIEINSSNCLIENCAVVDTGYLALNVEGIQSGALSIASTIRYCSVAHSSGIGISCLGEDLTVENCYVTDCGRQKTDIGVFNVYGGGHSNNEIAYNFANANSIYNEYNPDESKWGIVCYRIDNGGATEAGSGYNFHHNLGMSATTGKHEGFTLWTLPSTDPYYGNSGNKIYNNTIFGTFNFRDGDANGHGGTEVKNNIFSGYANFGSGEIPTGAIVEDNFFADTAVTGNFTGDPGWISPWEGNFLLRSDAAAIDAGQVLAGWTDGYSGSAPDVGAIEYGAYPPSYGAYEIDIDPSSLTYEIDTSAKSKVKVTGFAEGRGLPPTFRIKVGAGGTASDRYYNVLEDSYAILDFDLTGVTQPTNIFVSADSGSTWHDTGLAIDPNRIQSTASTPNGDPPPIGRVISRPAKSFDVICHGSRSIALNFNGDGTYTLQILGRGFQTIPEQRVPVTGYFEGYSDKSPYPAQNPPILLRLDSTLAASAGINAEGSNVRVFSEHKEFDYWVETPPGRGGECLIWFKEKALKDASLGYPTFEGESAGVWLSILDSPISESNVDNLFPIFNRASLRSWLKGHEMDLGSLETWSSAKHPGTNATLNDATQPLVASRPSVVEGALNGFREVSFDGSDDWLDFGDVMGLATDITVALVYRNPDPGTQLYQRMYSASSDSTSDSTGIAGYTSMTSGTSNAYPGGAVHIGRYTAKDCENFIIGARNNATHSNAYKGAFPEIVIFQERLDDTGRDALYSYLRPKYGVDATPFGEAGADFSGARSPIEVKVGAQVVPVDSVSGDSIQSTFTPTGSGTFDVTVTMPDGEVLVYQDAVSI
jgi:hypothetical protein